jgi:hypothetical protein
MATTPDQLELCTAGTGAYVPDWIKTGSQGGVANHKILKNSMGAGLTMTYAAPEESETSLLISNMI